MEQSGEEEEERGEERERQRGIHTGASRFRDAVVALRKRAAWEDLSVTKQMECGRGTQMTGMSDCHRLRREDM